MKTGSVLAIIIFTLVALAHLLRLLTGTEVLVGNYSVPQWISVAGAIVPTAISLILWKESK